MLGASSPGDITFDGLLVVMVMAVVIPLALGLFPRLPRPGSVVEILAGIIIGPAVLGWVSPDRAIQVLAKHPVNAASLVAAGMLSVLIFPVTALSFLRRPSAIAPTA